MGISHATASTIFSQRIINEIISNIKYARTIRTVAFWIWEEIKHQRCI